MSGAPVIAQECVCTRRGRFREKFLFRGGTAVNALCIVKCRGFFMYGKVIFMNLSLKNAILIFADNRKLHIGIKNLISILIT